MESASQFLANASLLLPQDMIPAKNGEQYSEEDYKDPAYVFAFNFLVLRAECDGSCGQIESSSRIINYLLQRGRSVRDRVRACNLNCIVLEASGNFHASVKVYLLSLSYYNNLIINFATVGSVCSSGNPLDSLEDERQSNRANSGRDHPHG